MTNGSVSAIEQARTVLENAYPPGVGSPSTLAEDTTAQNATNNAYQQLANVVILASLAIAGCTLAASVAAGLADRKRPFSLLRLAGARLGLLRRVVALESAVSLLAVAAPQDATGPQAGRKSATSAAEHRGHMPAVPPFRLTARAPADPEPDLCPLLVTHRAIGRDLARLAGRLGQIAVGGAGPAAGPGPAAGTAAGRYAAALLAQIRAHHEHEDRVLWQMVAVTAGECVDLAPLTDDHYTIEAELTRAGAALAAFRVPGREQAAALHRSVSGLRDMLREHIADEEGQIVPVMRRYLPARAYEWAQRRGWRHASPASLAFRAPWLARFATPGELSRVLLAGGRPARALLAVSRGRYTRLERQAFPWPAATRE